MSYGVSPTGNLATVYHRMCFLDAASQDASFAECGRVMMSKDVVHFDASITQLATLKASQAGGEHRG
jgi:hypothetical protein